jgi:hypothetical protein
MTTGRIVEPAVALIGQHEEGSGCHHFRDARDPEGYAGVESVTVVSVGRRSRSPALGRQGGLDPQKAPVHPRKLPARGGLGDEPIECTRRTHAITPPSCSRGALTGCSMTIG